jgi:hypothetical protein
MDVKKVVKTNDRTIATTTLLFILILLMKIRVKTNTPHNTKINDNMAPLLLELTLHCVENIHDRI